MTVKNCIGLVVLSMLWACSHVNHQHFPQPEAREVWIDASQPNTASLYYLLSGSYLSAWQEYGVADQVLNMAITQDPNSPQLHKAYFMNATKYYRSMISPETKNLLKSFLKDAQNEYQFDEDMLIDAYRAYEDLEDYEGMTWSATQLCQRYPSSRAYYYKYNADKKLLGKANTHLLEQAEAHLQNEWEMQQLLALSWLEIDEDRSIALLEEAPPNLLTETILLSLLDTKKDKGLPEERFKALSYPKDAEAMLGFLYFYNQKPDPQQVFAHKDKIVQIQDTGMLIVLATTALQAQSEPVFNFLMEHLHNKIPEPENDSKYAAIMLFQAIQNKNNKAIKEISELIFSSSDISGALFSAILHSNLSESELEQNKQEIMKAVNINLEESVLKDYLLFLLNGSSTNNLNDAAFNYSKYLWDKGFGAKADVINILNHYASKEDEQPQKVYLRQALKRWPRDAMLMNNLGYLLLNEPERWDEAEILISEALKQEPNSISYMDSMAWLHYLRKDYEKAHEYIMAVQATSVDSAELFYHIGMIYLATDNFEQAHNYLTRAAAANGPQSYVIKAKAQLLQMKKDPSD
ncbi:MAG: tetratricopeptide repeat protein [Candidatus Cloacimonetes bacterium]|jgi:Tfp pilus assembly protein PilF|nr:tetratricopeptide repeat protein [Candidatus Cloacimonadota bacterium]MDD4687259.1 tetratricopeptide repeat protein [Candidatus Cloacimonadota bacterium]MDY0298204.1 tetratricopeptide repeat protein [Candidatus Cloacimonadaceae bacterium]